jgi:hypothetical protein
MRHRVHATPRGNADGDAEEHTREHTTEQGDAAMCAAPGSGS